MKKRIEYTEKRGSILGGNVKCRHCGKVAKYSEVTYRIGKDRNREVGKMGYTEAPIQGPLCSNCSEIPPGKMPWSRGPRKLKW